MVSVDMVWAMSGEHIASFPQVSPATGGDALKLLLAPRVKAPPGLFSLILEGSCLEGGQTLGSLGVADDAFVTLHVVRAAVTSELREQIHEFVDWWRNRPHYVQDPAINEVFQCFADLEELCAEQALWHAFEVATAWIWSVSRSRHASRLEKLLAALGVSHSLVSNALEFLEREEEMAWMEAQHGSWDPVSVYWALYGAPSARFSALSSVASDGSGQPEDLIHPEQLEAGDPFWKADRGYQRFRQFRRSRRHLQRVTLKKARSQEEQARSSAKAVFGARTSPRKVKHCTLRADDYEGWY
mmetsp:Transcript_33694/g.75646  ORF Transcript_33694/g.75646 Transcript_33694/m.75646 type:complete len:299 (+) Transcript_33694:86-982(+)